MKALSNNMSCLNVIR